MLIPRCFISFATVLEFFIVTEFRFFILPSFCLVYLSLVDFFLALTRLPFVVVSLLSVALVSFLLKPTFNGSLTRCLLRFVFFFFFSFRPRNGPPFLSRSSFVFVTASPTTSAQRLYDVFTKLGRFFLSSLKIPFTFLIFSLSLSLSLRLVPAVGRAHLPIGRPARGRKKKKRNKNGRDAIGIRPRRRKRSLWVVSTP